MSNFYCQQKCTPPDFSIDEWNKSYKEIQAMPISEEEKRKLIDGVPCKEQCFECVAIVGEQRIKSEKYKVSSCCGRCIKGVDTCVYDKDE